MCPVAMELKVGNRTATPRQPYHLDGLAQSGYNVAVCYTIEEVNNFIMELIK